MRPSIGGGSRFLIFEEGEKAVSIVAWVSIRFHIHLPMPLTLADTSDALTPLTVNRSNNAPKPR